MKRIYTLMNTAFLILTVGSAAALESNMISSQPSKSSTTLNDADKEFIGYIDDYIYNSSTPFPADFKENMRVSSIKRQHTDLSIQFISNDHFNRVYNPLEDALLSADLISEGYFYRLDFLYTDEGDGVCQHTKFHGTQGTIKVHFDFPNIGYKTQVTKPLSEICGWVQRDKTPSQDTSFMITAQRNLFLGYIDIISKAMNTHWANHLVDKTLVFTVENETLVYTLRDNKPRHPISEKEAFEQFFPESMCQFVLPFKQLDIKVKVDIADRARTTSQIFKQDAKQLCVRHIKNIFNMK